MKRMKKLIAALMAVAMIASLNISAFATTDYTKLTGNGTTTPAVTESHVGNATTANGFESADAAAANSSSAPVYADLYDKAQGSVVSNVGYEGKMPENRVNIVMPAVPTGAFDMLLDPNDLIGEVAKGGEENTQRISGITANTDYVYFHNAATEDSEEGYSSSSDTLKITNKGYWPLNVKLTAEVQKGDDAENGALIQMVAQKTNLSQQTYKDIPAMYMEVASGTNKGVVADNYGTPAMAVANTASVGPKMIVGTPVFTWDATNGGLNRDRKIINNALAGAVLTVKATSSSAISVLFSGANTNNTATSSLSTTPAASYTVSPTGAFDTATSNADNSVTISVAQSSTASEKIDLGDGKCYTVLVYNIQMKRGSETTAKTYASIKFAIDPVNMAKFDATAAPAAAVKTANSTITFTKNASNSTGSTNTIAMNGASDAYMVSYNSTSHAYVKTLTDDAKTEDYAWPELSFNISAAINKTIAWDDLAATGTAAYSVNPVANLKTKIIWDVQNNYDADTSVNTPRVKVTKYAVNAGDDFQFKFNFGKGSNAAIAVVSLELVTGKAVVPSYGEPNGTTGKIAAITTIPTNGVWQTFTEDATDGVAVDSTSDGQLFRVYPKTVTSTATAKLTYLKADLTTGTVTFTYGAANA